MSLPALTTDHLPYYTTTKSHLLAILRRLCSRSQITPLITPYTSISFDFAALLASPLTTPAEQTVLARHYTHLLHVRVMFPTDVDPLRGDVVEALGPWDFEELVRVFGGFEGGGVGMSTDLGFQLALCGGGWENEGTLAVEAVRKKATMLDIRPRDLKGVYDLKHPRASPLGAVGCEVRAPLLEEGDSGTVDEVLGGAQEQGGVATVAEAQNESAALGSVE